MSQEEELQPTTLGEKYVAEVGERAVELGTRLKAILQSMVEEEQYRIIEVMLALQWLQEGNLKFLLYTKAEGMEES